MRTIALSGALAACLSLGAGLATAQSPAPTTYVGACGHGLALPVFSVAANSGLSGPPAMVWSRLSFLRALRQWAVAAFRVSETTVPRPALGVPPEVAKGTPIEVAGRRDRGFDYTEDFAEVSSLEAPRIEGVECVRWLGPGEGIELRGLPGRRTVAACYRFTSPFEMKEIYAELEGAIEGPMGDRVELAFSLDGERFVHPVQAFGRQGGNAFRFVTHADERFHGGGFWVRLRAELSPGSRATLRGFHVRCRVKPPCRSDVALQPDGEGRLVYREPFASSKIFFLSEIRNARALTWERGRLYVAERGDGPVEVVLRQKFVSPEPLRAVAVRIHNAVAATDGQATNSFGLSLDGRTLLATDSTRAAGQAFEGVTELRLDEPSRLAETREFYLHMVLAGQGGAQAAPSNVLTRIEVEARPAHETVETAAAPGPPPARP
ncbi:MAG: hypothetical protein ACLF0G_17415 [Candidatus Brocadiia bacterium]